MTLRFAMPSVRHLVCFLPSVLLWTGASPAATVYVDGRIAASSCTTYDPVARSCGSGSLTAYSTLAGGASAAVPGTVVYIRGGTYAEPLRPAYSGTAQAPIVFAGYGGETAIITGLFTPAVNLVDRSYMVIQNLTVSNVYGWFRSENGSHNTVRGNQFYHATVAGTTAGVKFVRSNDNRVLDNIISDGADNLLFIESDRNLAQGNTITTAKHAIFGVKCGNYNVIRGNYFANNTQKIGEMFDCEGIPSDSPFKLDATKHNLVEYNDFALTLESSVTYRYNGFQYAAQESIVRRNWFHNNDGGAMGMSLYASEALHDKQNRVYHNVIYNNGCFGVWLTPLIDGGEAFDNRFRNNIIFKNRACTGGVTQIIAGVSPYDFQFNDILFDSPAEPIIQALSGGASNTLAWWRQAQYPQLFHQNIEKDPLFVNPDALDFRLQPESPMIDAGGFMSVTTAAGSGTSLPLEDVDWVFDGFGVSGEKGDVIQLQGQAERARVVAIDYAGKRITVDRPLAWAAGQGIALAYSGAAPDIGAIESERIVAADLDADGRVDETDVEVFKGCAAGAAIAVTEPCLPADFDHDGDVDMDDFGGLQACLRPNGPADPLCLAR